MKILITGDRGFIGQNMVKALSEEHTLSFFEWGESEPDVTGLDWVIHLGAISSTTEKNVERVLNQNYDFSCWLLHQCHNKGVNFQYASSASVYGLNQNFKENAPVNPLSPYAWSKYLFDRYVLENDWQGIFVQGFRYFNVYGPHESHKGNQASPFYQFETQARDTGVIKLFEGSENYLRDFVPVETVCNVHRRFFDVYESGIWNVGTGETMSFKDVADLYAVLYNARIEYIPMPDSVKNQYQTYTCADITRLKKYYDPSSS
jgi:ADP-L-glycero-D-manno-heptose 6-epimerase